MPGEEVERVQLLQYLNDICYSSLVQINSRIHMRSGWPFLVRLSTMFKLGNSRAYLCPFYLKRDYSKPKFNPYLK